MASSSPSPNSLIVVGEGTGIIPHSKRISVTDKHKSQQKHSHESKLHVLSPKGDYVENFFGKETISNSSSRPSSAASRPRSGGIGARLDSAGGRRSQTPTKTVALQAVRRKDDSDFSGFENFDWNDKQSVSPASSNIDRPISASSVQLEERLSDMSIEKKGAQFSMSATSALDQHDPSTIHTNNSNNSDSRHVESTSVQKSPDLEGDNSDEDDDDDSEDDETRAPNELIMEFLTCLMEKDYKNAEKLCKMILIYEPDNADALKFQPLLEEKQKLDLEKANASSDEDTDEEVDDDSSSDDDDDSDSSDDSSSEEDSTDDEEEEEQEEAPEKKVDSGIASASD